MQLTHTLVTLLSLLRWSVTADTVKVGVLLPTNESYAWSSKKILPALQLATDMVTSRKGPLPGYRLELMARDSKCSLTQAPLEAIELYSKDRVHVFFGPVCDYAVAPLARFSPTWGIPVLTAGAFARDFKNKMQYKLLTRLMGSYSDVATFFLEVMKMFRWKHVGLGYSRGINFQCHITIEAFYRTLQKAHNYSPWYIRFDNLDVTIDKLFDKLENEARVLVLCTEPDQVRKVVIKARERFPDGDYAVFNIDLFASNSQRDTPWYRKMTQQKPITRPSLRMKPL